MTKIRIEFADDFRGEDVVLLSMDGAGAEMLGATLKRAERLGAAVLRLDGQHLEFVVRPGTTEIDLDGSRVVWRLDPAKIVEVCEKLNVLIESGNPGHQYVDISKPTATLVLSRDEYSRRLCLDE